MRIVKPNWVIHGDEKGNPQTIYSVHVHPDGTRVATGSIQNVVKIWSTAPILDSASETSGEEKVPRLLCSMEGHDGAVLCVRWTYSGGFLATGSDDSIIMVWLRCPGQSRSFGSKTANIEDWKPFKRLAGHTSDVSGLAWSEDDQYLASVGLDNLVLIWDCLDSSFLLLRRLDLHQGHVNGVAWDPVGQFLATQSDDRSVKIWRTSDWKLEADIIQPFIESPRSFFRRLSWSPEGAHLVTPNAMNGPVFVSSVIERAQWTSDISLVGHHNVVEVAAYNPHVFLRNKDDPLEGRNLCAALALGARSSISIWLTSSSVPLLVLHDVFNRDILDLSWAADGVTLYACSSDGHVAVLVIEELKSIITMAPPEAKAEYHKNYQFKKPDRRQQSRSSLTPYTQRYPSPMPIEPYKPGSVCHPPISSLDQASASRSSPNSLAKQEMTIMPNGKRRIRPVFLGTTDGDMYSMPQVNGHSTSSVQSSYAQTYNPHPQHSQRNPNDSMALDSHPSTSQHPLSAASRVPKFLTEDPIPSNPSSFGMGELLIWDDNDEWSDPITIPATLLKAAKHSDPELQLDCHNVRESIDEASHYAEVKLLASSQREQIWMERFPRRMAISAAVCSTHFAIAFHDGSLFVFSRSGRRTLPVVMMDCPCYVLQFREQMLMAISSKGAVMIWDLEHGKTMGPALQLKDLEVSKRSISFSALTATGLPVIGMKNGSLFTYDRDLQCWTFLVDGLLAGPKSLVQISRLAPVDGSPLALDAAMVLGSKTELQTCLVNHAKSLRDENSFAKAEELCEELWTGRRCGSQSVTMLVVYSKVAKDWMLITWMNLLSTSFFRGCGVAGLVVMMFRVESWNFVSKKE